MAVSVEISGMLKGAMAEAGATPSPFLTEHSDIIGWLDVLLKGKSEEQARARTEIAMILESRGFADDAEEAYWTNVQARSADRRAYERLIALYQERKDRLSESLVRRQFDEVFSERATPAAGPGPEQSGHPVRRLRSAARAADGATPIRTDNPRLGLPPTPETVAPRPSAPTPAPTRPLPAGTDPGTSSPAQPGPLPEAAGQAGVPAVVHQAPRPGGRPAVPIGPRAQAVPHRDLASAAAAQAIWPDAVVSPEAAGAPRGRRRATLSPNPGGPRFRFSTGGLIALQPMTILAFLLASVGAAAMISLLLISVDRGTVKTVSAASAVPARCADASQRFPGTNDPRAAVAAAYKQQGVDVDAPKPGGPRLTPDQADLVVGGWIATSLRLEHNGQPAPSLTDWLDPASARPTLANSILSGRGLDSMLTADEWSQMQSWPTSTCEGAFLHDARNAGQVKLIERVVKK